MIKFGFHIKTVQDAPPVGKTVLVRSDFDVSINKNKIADDTRIQKALPTIQFLLTHKNKVILVSKLGRPKERDEEHSLKHIIPDLQKHFPSFSIVLVDDFLSEKGQEQIKNQTQKEIILLENIRFYKEEKENNAVFSKQLASLAEVFVLDAFAMSHRKENSVTGVAHFLPSLAGIELEKEVNAIMQAVHEAKKPVVSIIGGAKIPDKLAFLAKLIEVSDYLLVGGGIANTFLFSEGLEIGTSICDKEEKHHVFELVKHATKCKTDIILPKDVVGKKDGKEEVYKVTDTPSDFQILDIGPETQALFGSIIAKAKTVIWNGPMGYIEEAQFAKGTDFMFYSIADNAHCYSLLGGGDTLAAISKEEYLEKISHISTGGGAMLELIENGTLPGLEALKDSKLRLKL